MGRANHCHGGSGGEGVKTTENKIHDSIGRNRAKVLSSEIMLNSVFVI